MNYIKITKHSDFKELLEEDILITGKASRQKEELDYNTWGIMFDYDFVAKVTLQDLQNFFAELKHYKSMQLKKNKYKGPVTLYIWVEDMSLQLCFDILSGSNIKLPFRNCKLNILKSMDPILQNFLDAAQRAAVRECTIGIEEIKFFEPGDPGFDDFDKMEVDKTERICDVYVTTLP
ncbi:MAG: hypothetical protein WC747_01625 [Candidatus Babeliales bacterium]|jgi:hypothetical protein